MSYETTFGGLAAYGGGFGYFGLSGSYPIREPDPGMRELQQQLQRLGYLQGGSGIYGADGEFGPRTATALRSAASYVEWTGAPYSPSDAAERRSGTVSVPDDLIQRLRTATPNPDAPFAQEDAPSPSAPVEPTEPSVTIGPHLDPEEPRDSGDNKSWIVAAVAGVSLIGVGAVVAFGMQKKKKKKAVRANRKRRRTSRRRRR